MPMPGFSSCTAVNCLKLIRPIAWDLPELIKYEYRASFIPPAEISLHKIKAHPWFKEIDWNCLEQVRAVRLSDNAAITDVVGRNESKRHRNSL